LTDARRAGTWRPDRIVGALCLLALSGLLAACGGAGTGTAVAASGDVVGYCALSQEVNTSGNVPSSAQVTELIRLAPPEIRGDVTTALRAGDASDTGVQAFTRVLDYESAHC
jgi:hypothetical protein